MRVFWKIRNHMRASRPIVARGWSYPLNLPVSFLNTVLPRLMMGTRSENYVLCKRHMHAHKPGCNSRAPRPRGIGCCFGLQNLYSM